MSDMEHCVKVSNRCVEQVSSLTYVYDVREWIRPHLDDIRYHTQPHIFLFKRNPASGRSEMFYKHWSHSPWEPDKKGLTLLKVYLDYNYHYNNILSLVHAQMCRQCLLAHHLWCNLLWKNKTYPKWRKTYLSMTLLVSTHLRHLKGGRSYWKNFHESMVPYRNVPHTE